MKLNKKILMCLLAIGTLVVLITSNGIQADETITTQNEGTTRALTDSAFPESSKPLHDALIATYPGIDGGDGEISQADAASWNGQTINLGGKGLTGTLDGLEYFTNTSLKNIYLYNNEFFGSIPTNIGNISSLEQLNLSSNNINGSIPESLWTLTEMNNLSLSYNSLSGTLSESIGNLTKLESFTVTDNQLSGNLPVNLGELSKIYNLGLALNDFTGEIPSSYGNLLLLKKLYLYDTNLSGEIPESFKQLTNLELVAIQNNPQLTGNTVEIFENCNSLTHLEVQGSGVVQAQPDIAGLDSTSGGTFIYDDLSEALLNTDKTGPAEGLTQEDIDKAQESANNWTEPTKSQWQDNIDKAQDMLDAQDSVLDLLNDTKTDVKETTTQKLIDDARALVTALPDGQYKTDLQAEIDLAQEYLNNRLAAQAKVEDLFTDTNHVNIKNTTNQKAIDDAQVLVNALPDSVFKDALQVEIDKAQAMLDAKGVVDDLFTDSKHIDINDTTDQEVIDNARNVVSQLPDGELKTELNEEIDKAQDMLNAKDKVDGLFTDDTHTNIIDGLTQKDIDKAQDAVDRLPNGSLKDELQKAIDKAQDMLNARDAANDLLDKDGNLNSGVTQKEIDEVQDLVNKLPDGDLKTELQAIIDEAQKQLDAQNKKNPSTAPTVDASSSVGGKSVNTSDATNLSLYGGLLLLSLGGLVVFMKKREME